MKGCFPNLLHKAALMTVLLPLTALAQPDSGGPADPSELEAFIDGLMAAHLRAHNTPGAVVSVVRGGELFFAKGYGYADAAARRPVVPDTLWPITALKPPGRGTSSTGLS
jgi:CubicO group peptidase (beta-lactamase class C family)